MKPIKHIKNIKYCIIGVDEAGRGAWAGPVVAACVAWSGRNPIRGILRDSKKMTVADRETTYEIIQKLAENGKIAVGVGIIDATVIDSVGIREANRRAMSEALAQVQSAKFKEQSVGVFPVILGRANPPEEESEDPGIQQNKLSQSESLNLSGLDSRLASFAKASATRGRGNDGNCLLLIDGRDNYTFDIPDLPKPEYIVRGDSKIPQIMAASIVAKVTRDRLMIDFESTFLGYGFAKHKGYGTQLHQKTLREIGVCGIHRKSYKPIKELLSLEKIVPTPFRQELN